MESRRFSNLESGVKRDSVFASADRPSDAAESARSSGISIDSDSPRNTESRVSLAPRPFSSGFDAATANPLATSSRGLTGADRRETQHGVDSSWTRSESTRAAGVNMITEVRQGRIEEGYSAV